MRLGRLQVGSRHLGVALCVPAVALLWQRSLALAAVGLELFAAAF